MTAAAAAAEAVGSSGNSAMWSVASSVVACIIIVICFSAGEPRRHDTTRRLQTATWPPPLVTWDAYLGTCEPPDVCQPQGAVRLDTLQPFLTAPVALLRALGGGPWYDAEAARRCFRGKRVTILGDSSMQEVVFDIYHLLAGLHRAHNYMVPDGEEEIHHGTSTKKTVKIKVSPLDPDVMVSFIGSELVGGHDASRNVTVEVPELDTIIRFRWGAGEHIDTNFGGLTEILNGGSMRQELNCLMGVPTDPPFADACPRPDFFIVQTGAHELYKAEPLYAPDNPWNVSFAQFLPLLSAMAAQGTKVVWKGTPTPERVPHDTRLEGERPFHEMNVADEVNRQAQEAAPLHNFTFVDLTPAYRTVATYRNFSVNGPGDPQTFYESWPHVGYNGHKNEILVSTLLTQLLLRALC